MRDVGFFPTPTCWVAVISIRSGLLLGNKPPGDLGSLGERLFRPLLVVVGDPEIGRSIDCWSVLFFVFSRLSTSLFMSVLPLVLVALEMGLVSFNNDTAQVTAHHFTVVTAVVALSLLFKPF